MSVSAYPLQWPDGWPRTPWHKRADGRRRWSSGGKPWTFDAARKDLANELERLGASNVVLSTNYELRIDGAPRASQRVPDDVGIAVYFTRKGKQVVMARDAFDRAEENIRSLTLALRAIRAIDEHGGSMMMDRAFAGFEAIAAPGARRSWREVLGIHPTTTVSATEVEHFFRQAAKKAHPDTGGSHAAMAELNAARDEALKAVRS